MRLLTIALLASILLTGCSLTPIPKNINTLRQKSLEDFRAIQPYVQPGDVIFRLGTTRVAGGLLDFSKTVASMSDSDFSHACIVLQGDDILVADITKHGIERRYFRDWHIGGTENLVVKRLRPEYRHLLPKVMAALDELIDKDVLYNADFDINENKYYCTQVVDHVFRVNGSPLASQVRIKDLPRYNVLIALCCLIARIDPNQEIVVAGNNEIGLFSSPMLQTVVDLRDGHRNPSDSSAVASAMVSSESTRVERQEP